MTRISLKGHKLIKSTGTCTCGWIGSGSKREIVRNEYSDHLYEEHMKIAMSKFSLELVQPQTSAQNKLKKIYIRREQ